MATNWYGANQNFRQGNYYDGAQEYNENLNPNNPNYGKSFAGIGHFDYNNLNRLPSNLTQDLGAATYRAPPVYPGQRNIHEGFGTADVSSTFEPPEKTGIFQAFKKKLSGFTTPGMALMKRMVEPNTPEEDFGLKYFGDRNTLSSSGRTYGNQAYDVFAGKNVASAFGQGMGGAAQKRIDRINKTLGKWESDEEKYAKQLANTTLYRRRDEFKKQLAEYNKKLGDATGGADTTIITTKPGTTGDGYTGPRTYDFDRGAFQRSGGQRASTPAGHTDPGKGSYGPWKAQGGRVGLYAGGDPEEPAENIFEVMQDQNIPFSEQVEGDPFDIRIQELMDKGLSYDDAYDIAAQEFQDLFSERSEQGEGIASLV